MKNQSARILKSAIALAMLVPCSAFAQADSTTISESESAPSTSGADLRSGTSVSLRTKAAAPRINLLKRNFWEVGIGLPQALYVKLSRYIAPRHLVGIGFGGVPAQLAVPQLQAAQHTGYSEDFDLTINPRASIYTMQVSYSYFLTARNFISMSPQLIYVTAGADTALRERKTGNTVMLANLDVTLIQPALAVQVGRRLLVTRSGRLEGTLGVTVLGNAVVTSQVRGALPSYLALNPAARESVTDGIDDVKGATEDYLTRTVSQYSVLPSLSLSWTW